MFGALHHFLYIVFFFKLALSVAAQLIKTHPEIVLREITISENYGDIRFSSEGTIMINGYFISLSHLFDLL